MSTRRGRGEGSIYQRHAADCPPADESGDRPDHRCRGLWAAQVDLGWSNGKRVRKTVYGKTKVDVQKKMAVIKKSAPSTSYTVETWMLYWLDRIAPERCRPQTLRSHRSKTKTYIIPLLGKHRLDRLEPRHLREAWARLQEDCPDGSSCPHAPSHGLSPATVRQTHAILQRALTVAVREEAVDRNVATLIDAPKTTKERRNALTPAQAKLVLAVAADDPMISRWYAALYLGMRQGECLGLSWSKVNLDEGLIFVERTLVAVKGGLAYGAPKSASSRRVIPLPPVVLAHMRVRWAQWLQTGAGTGASIDALVWAQEDGTPIHPKTDWSAWSELLERAGVEHVALHSARNTASKLYEDAGMPARLAAEILGHSHVDMTHSYQSGTSIETKRKAIEAL